MRNYQIYLIEDEFARHYLGREIMFYNLFLDYYNSSGELKEVINKQILFISKPIPILQLQQIFEYQLKAKKDFTTKNGIYYIHKNNGNSMASLEIKGRELQITAEGTYEAETAFFECIRKCEASFLALDLSNRKYGWLKPIKERKFV